MSAREGFLTAAGKRLEYRRIGDEDPAARVLVLLHEGLGCVGTWRDFPDRLAEHTAHPVFLYSRAGYGGSDPVELPRGPDYMHVEALEVLPEVLAAAGIGRSVLVGHSDGASIALIFAGAAHPSGLEGLVLLAPHVFNETRSVAGIRAAREAYTRGDLRARLRRHHGENVDCAFRGWNDIWLHPDFERWNIEPCLDGIRAPVLLIQGEDDEYGTLRQLEAIETRVPAPVTRLVLEHCGHAPHRAALRKTLDAVAAFVGALDAEG